MPADAKPTPRYEVVRNRITRRYRVRSIARNGECLDVSQSLSSEAAARTNIEAKVAMARDPETPVTWI